MSKTGMSVTKRCSIIVYIKDNCPHLLELEIHIMREKKMPEALKQMMATAGEEGEGVVG